MSEGINESHVEAAALDWFKELGYSIGHGPHLATLRDMLLPKLLSGEIQPTGELCQEQ